MRIMSATVRDIMDREAHPDEQRVPRGEREGEFRINQRVATGYQSSCLQLARECYSNFRREASTEGR